MHYYTTKPDASAASQTSVTGLKAACCDDNMNVFGLDGRVIYI